MHNKLVGPFLSTIIESLGKLTCDTYISYDSNITTSHRGEV